MQGESEVAEFQGASTMPKSLVSDKILESSGNALFELQSAFAVPLRLYLFNGAWHQLDHHHNITSDAALTHQWFDMSVIPCPSLNQPEPFLHSVSAGFHVVGIPVESTRSAVVYAVGESESGLDTLLRAISIQSQQIRELREESHRDSIKFDSFSDQILHSFEERSWLLQLTDHLEMCEVSRNMGDVVQNLLPRLRAILCAESVAFLPESSPGVFKAPVIETREPGNAPASHLKIPEIVAKYRSRALIQPFICNWGPQDTGPDCIRGVQSLMIACVARDSQVVGWLMALNAEPNPAMVTYLTVDKDDPKFSDIGFGTPEAGLLKSAASVLATHHHNLKLFHANRSLTVGVVRSLADAVDARDTYTHGHSDRVARLGHHLARRIGASAQTCEQLLMTGMLHDIGKIGVPDYVLLKADRLSAEEFDLIKRHPVIGHQILQHITELDYTLDGVLYHHEAWDGSGYPAGLTGKNIPLSGRLLAVVDAFDAMTSNRPYRNRMSFDKAEKILYDGAGTQWDPELVTTFLQHKDEFRNICLRPVTECQSIDMIDLNALYMNNGHLEAVVKSAMSEAAG